MGSVKKIAINTQTAPENKNFDLQSLVDSHDRPFVVIDTDYNIVAINKAYRQAYSIDGQDVIGSKCFQISHHNDKPCCELGEECPHSSLFSNGKSNSCIHVHYDQKHRMHQVRVKAFPLRDSNGELFLGELIEEIALPQQTTTPFKPMVGESTQFLACLEQLRMVAAASPPVLLQGETGTGKELAAGYIHDHSARRDKPFLTVDCTTLTDTLFEAEVFGHTRGAYTGSVGEKPGLFEQAHGGTLFLDEIGDMPMAQQSKLLRILETGQFRRVGGRSTREVDVRIICASNRHLWDAVRDGQFREDLYYRIACLTVRMPSLRERLDDIGVLANTLLIPVGQTMQRQLSLSEDAIQRLRAYDFPGNIRELKNILFVAATHSRQDELGGEVVNRVIEQLTRGRARHNPAGPMAGSHGLQEQPDVASSGVESPQVVSLQGNEARHIAELLKQFDGNRRRIAQSLGISERTLYRKLRKYSLS